MKGMMELIKINYGRILKSVVNYIIHLHFLCNVDTFDVPYIIMYYSNSNEKPPNKN